MRKLIMLSVILAATSLCRAEPKAYVMTIPMGTSTTATNAFGGANGITGIIGEVMIAVSDAASTGNVLVSYTPLDGYSADVNIATNAVTATKTFRPVLDGTDTAGVALTSDPPNSRYLLCGEQVGVIVSESPTGVTWRVTMKME